MPRGSEASRAERLPRGCFRASSGGASVLPGDLSSRVYGLALRGDWEEGIRRPVLKNEKDHSQK